MTHPETGYSAFTDPVPHSVTVNGMCTVPKTLYRCIHWYSAGIFIYTLQESLLLPYQQHHKGIFIDALQVFSLTLYRCIHWYRTGIFIYTIQKSLLLPYQQHHKSIFTDNVCLHWHSTGIFLETVQVYSFDSVQVHLYTGHLYLHCTNTHARNSKA